MSELDAGKILVIGLIASVLGQILKLLFAKIGKPIDRKVVTVILLIISLVLAWFWMNPVFPVFPVMTPEMEAMAYAVLLITFLGELLALASALTGFAVVIYNLLLQKVFEQTKIGDTAIKQLTAEAQKAKG